MLPRKILKISVLSNDFSYILSALLYHFGCINCNFLSAMGGFNVLDGREEDIGYGEKQTTRISSLIFLSFVEILSMITS